MFGSLSAAAPCRSLMVLMYSRGGRMSTREVKKSTNGQLDLASQCFTGTSDAVRQPQLEKNFHLRTLSGSGVLATPSGAS